MYGFYRSDIRIECQKKKKDNLIKILLTFFRALYCRGGEGSGGRRGRGLMGGCAPCVYYHALFCLLADSIFGMPGFLPTKISVQMVGHGMD